MHATTNLNVSAKVTSVNSNGTTAIKVQWNAVSGASKYSVYYEALDRDWNASNIVTGTSANFDLYITKKVYFYVEAQDASSRMLAKDERTLTLPSNPKTGSALSVSAPTISRHIHTSTAYRTAKAATCDKEGWACNHIYTVCCDKYWDYNNENKQLQKSQVVIPATGNHSWGSWYVTKPATRTEEGIETRTCSVCSKKETRAIPVITTPIEYVAFASFDSSNGTLTFFREDKDKYSHKQTIGTKTYYKIDETKKYEAYEIPWKYNGENADKIKKIVFENEIHPVSTSCWFYKFTNLTTIENLALLDTSNVTDMGSMFYNCTNLKTADVSNFDTSNVTRMAHMFEGCENLEGLDLSNFDVRNVTSFYEMFKGCKKLSTLDLSSFDTSNNNDGVSHLLDTAYVQNIAVGENTNISTSLGNTVFIRYEDLNGNKADTKDKLTSSTSVPGWYKKATKVSTVAGKVIIANKDHPKPTGFSSEEMISLTLTDADGVQVKNTQGNTSFYTNPEANWAYSIDFYEEVYTLPISVKASAWNNCPASYLTYSNGSDTSSSPKGGYYDVVYTYPCQDYNRSTEENRIEPTCEKSGSYDLAYYCQLCGKETRREKKVISTKGHSWNDFSSPDAKGIAYSSCTKCNKQKIAITITSEIINPPSQHVFFDNAFLINKKGEKLRLNIGSTPGIELESAPITIDHTYSTQKPGDGPYSTSSNSSGTYYHCPLYADDGPYTIDLSECSSIKNEQYKVTYSNGTSTSSTPKAEYYYLTIERKVEPCTHSSTRTATENYVNATCEEAGSYDQVTYCSKCGAEISRKKTTIYALGHNWGGWTTIKEPTVTQTGIKKRSCSRCQKEETQSIPKHTHTWGEWTVTKAATQTEEGIKQRICSVCGEKETAKIEKLKTDSSTNQNPASGTGQKSTSNSTQKSAVKSKANTPKIKTVYDLSKPTKVNAKRATKAAKISWKKPAKKQLKKFTHYQIEYSKDSFFGNSQIKLVSKSKTSFTIKGLEKNKYYYVRIREYKKQGSTIHASKWVTKKVKTK